MQLRIIAFLLGVLVSAGCAIHPEPTVAPAPEPEVKAPNSNQAPNPDYKVIITPEELLVGRVATYNAAGRFVVLECPIGKMPALDQVLFVYRRGLKVGEIRVTGPERDQNTVADLTSGEAEKGDEVRDK